MAAEMTKTLRCTHCGHFVGAATWDAADRAMVAHYVAKHPERKYAEPIDLDIDEAIRRGKLSEGIGRRRTTPEIVRIPRHSDSRYG